MVQIRVFYSADFTVDTIYQSKLKIWWVSGPLSGAYFFPSLQIKKSSKKLSLDDCVILILKQANFVSSKAFKILWNDLIPLKTNKQGI